MIKNPQIWYVYYCPYSRVCLYFLEVSQLLMHNVWQDQKFSPPPFITVQISTQRINFGLFTKDLRLNFEESTDLAVTRFNERARLQHFWQRKRKHSEVRLNLPKYAIRKHLVPVNWRKDPWRWLLWISRGLVKRTHNLLNSETSKVEVLLIPTKQT